MDVEITKIEQGSRAEVEQLWQRYMPSDNPFLSSAWLVETYTNSQHPQFLVKALKAGQIIAFGLFSVTRSNRLFRSKQTWHLHKSGNHSTDMVWIEHNDFIFSGSPDDDIRNRILRFVLANPSYRCDEIVFGCTTVAVGTNCLAEQALIEKTWSQKSFRCSVNTQETYLQEALSKNTRRQITRSIKLYGESLAANALSHDDALEQFSHVADLHIQRWGKESGFHCANFTEFHRNLIKDADSPAQIIRISNDSGTLGYIYLLIGATTAYFYLSALTEAANNKLKPGLVAHTLTIDYLARHFPTIKYYDFLAGDSRYKRSLAEPFTDQSSYLIRKKNLKNHMVLTLKKIKAKISTVFN